MGMERGFLIGQNRGGNVSCEGGTGIPKAAGVFGCPVCSKWTWGYGNFAEERDMTGLRAFGVTQGFARQT